MQLGQDVLEVFNGKVDRHISGGLQGAKEGFGFLTVTSAQINQTGAFPQSPCDFSLVLLKDLLFSAGGVVFWQVGDGREQMGAQVVIKKFGRNASIGVVQPLDDFDLQAFRAKRRLDVEELGLLHNGLIGIGQNIFKRTLTHESQLDSQNCSLF